MENLNEYGRLAIMSLVSILTLFIISKLLGKKQIAQLEFIDYIIGISIGSIAAEMATDVNDKPIWYYLLAMAIFFVVDVLFTLVSRTTPFFKHFLKGKPLLLINNGEIDYDQLNKSKLDVNDLLALCRGNGYFDIKNIAYAIFENNGKLSIMPNGKNTPVVIEDIKKEYNKATLPLYLVIDGRIVFDSLDKLNKDTEWLFKSLNITDKKELKNILLAIYDDATDKVDIHKKDN